MALSEAVPKEATARAFKKLMAQPANRVCFDCPQRKPIWASATFGVFICLDCAGDQRRLGTHVTFVRSCDMDSWTRGQLEAMKRGGNGRAADFFRAHGVRDLHLRKDLKYASATARQYRDRLAKEVQAAVWGAPPTPPATTPEAPEKSFFDDFEPMEMPPRTQSSPSLATPTASVQMPVPRAAPDAAQYRVRTTAQMKRAGPSKGGGLSAAGLSAAGAAPRPTSAATVSGALLTPMQKHFHMETHSARCAYEEGGLLRLNASTQDPTLTQKIVAKVLGLRDNAVAVENRRAGGGFGGKLTLHLPAAVAVSLVAARRRVDARYQADRRDDMAMTGGREACAAAFTAGFDRATGRLTSYDVTFALESGCASNDGVGDLGMAVAWSDGAYSSGAHHAATGTCSRTTAPRNSSMRSPGVLQSHGVRELAIARIAHATKLPIHVVQETNLYADGDRFPYSTHALGSPTFNYTLPALYASLRPKFLERLAACAAFNEANTWRKRGVHVMPTKFIVALSAWKIPALVNIYGDGSVTVAHGGSEIGQGIHVKVAAVVAYSLGCPLDAVNVAPTATDRTPNSGATGGSGTSESSCAAAANACAVLKERLAPYAKAHGAWADAVAAALGAAVELSATGWNDVPGTGADPDYATYGCCFAEVEVDVLTGEVEVAEIDVAMDQGNSLNSDVDVGQVEGALVMALGYWLTEACAADHAGKQSGDGTWNYKPPQAQDVPLKLKVSMLPRTPNPAPVAVLGSKASGEPPMQCAAAVYFALRAAIAAARADRGDEEWFDLAVPASPEVVRAACGPPDAALSLA